MLKVKDIEIRWNHVHNQDNSKKLDDVKKPLTKATTRCLLVKDDKVLDAGWAYCSWVDNFSYDKGRKISLKKALSTSGLDKLTRTMIWEAYRNMPENGTRW